MTPGMPSTITLEQILNFLLEAPMFGDLDPAELSQVVHVMQVLRVRAGQPVFREGEAGDAWYVVYEGKCAAYKGVGAQRRLIITLGPRACFGEMAILDHSPRSATVIAEEDTTLFRYPRREFEGLLATGNLAAYKLVHEIARVLSARARATTQQLGAVLADADPDAVRERARQVVEGQSVSE
jgi:CRP/FNR family cyclic AMP-dependent transcriptional regulator